MTPPRSAAPGRLAFTATAHCLAGCAIGEILGMVIGTSLGWRAGSVVALSVALAFVFGYAFTVVPLRASGLSFGAATRLAIAADTLSIAMMEIVDNAIMVTVPGAMDAGVGDPFFWITLAVALLVAGVAAYPINYWLIQRGRGHALVHQPHASQHTEHDHHAGGDSDH